MTYHILTFEGKLVGVTPFDWVSLPGVSIETVDGEIPDLNSCTWDEVEQTLIPIAMQKLTKLDFMSKFTTQERVAVQQSTDPILKDAMTLLQLSEFIDVTDQRTMMLVGYMAMTGVILDTRVAEILS
jgi:hypothetical protein